MSHTQFPPKTDTGFSLDLITPQQILQCKNQMGYLDFWHNFYANLTPFFYQPLIPCILNLKVSD